jgi:FkbM family methyltransferase
MSPEAWAPPREIVTQEWLEAELRPDAAATVAREERALLDRLAGGAGADLVLFGAGNLGRRTLEGLRRAGVEPLAFADSSHALQGSKIDGLTVLAPAEAASAFGERATFVVTVWSPSRQHVIAEISLTLQGLGVRRVVSFVPLFWERAAEFLPYCSVDLPHKVYADGNAVREAFSSFRDGESRKEFLLQLTYLLSTMDTVDLPRGEPARSYFPHDLVELSSQEVFVDCGAYDGDSVESFLEASGGRFRAIVAFEPDPAAVLRLRALVQGLPPSVRDHVRVEQKAVGAAAGTLRFEGGGTPGSRVSEAGALTVDCVTLDEALGDLAPTFIKMDIEGAEEDALLGAAETIRRHRPILAICVYHLQAHLYRLPLLMGSLCEDYSFFLRRQGPDGDLVCFGIPNERLSRQSGGGDHGAR